MRLLEAVLARLCLGLLGDRNHRSSAGSLSKGKMFFVVAQAARVWTFGAPTFGVFGVFDRPMVSWCEMYLAGGVDLVRC